MKNFKFFILLFAIFLASCSSNLKDKEQYGVRYTINDNEWLTLKLDPENNDVITAMICVMNGPYDSQIETFLTGSVHDDKNKTPLIYVYSENLTGDYYSEYLVINFEGNDLSSYQDIIHFIGLTNEFSDYILTYKELLNSETFRYNKFFKDGEFENNISFTNDDAYNVEFK